MFACLSLLQAHTKRRAAVRIDDDEFKLFFLYLPVRLKSCSAEASARMPRSMGTLNVVASSQIYFFLFLARSRRLFLFMYSRTVHERGFISAMVLALGVRFLKLFLPLPAPTQIFSSRLLFNPLLTSASYETSIFI